jgi:hypothetical protein
MLEKRGQALVSFHIRVLIPSDQALSLTTSSNTNYLTKAPSPKAITLMVRALIQFLWEDTSIQSLTGIQMNMNP